MTVWITARGRMTTLKFHAKVTATLIPSRTRMMLRLALAQLSTLDLPWCDLRFGSASLYVSSGDRDFAGL